MIADIAPRNRPALRFLQSGVVACVAALLLLTACGGHISSSSTVTVVTVDEAINAMLLNLHEHGYDGSPALNDGLGGMWINWRSGNGPLQTNFNGSGVPDDASATPRHDGLTDLRYVHVLWLYKSQHAGDTRFDDDISRYSAIVKKEFASADNSRGWVFDELLALYHLSGDAFYQQTAQGLLGHFMTLYHPETGAIYTTDPQHPTGYYRVDLALEIGCALIQGGTLFGQRKWIDAGQNIVAFVYAHAYLPQYHVFLLQMGDVLTSSGQANADETIYRGRYNNEQIEGGGVKVGALAQLVLSLLQVYVVTKDQAFLTHATDILDALLPQNNALGLWDSEHLGYFISATFHGPDYQQPGAPVVSHKEKESGRQFQLLEAYHLACSLTHEQHYAVMQAQLVQVFLHDAYYPTGQGVLYATSNTWHPLMTHGLPEDWVTAEAMEISLEGLLSLAANPVAQGALMVRGDVRFTQDAHVFLKKRHLFRQPQPLNGS